MTDESTPAPKAVKAQPVKKAATKAAPAAGKGVARDAVDAAAEAAGTAAAAARPAADKAKAAAREATGKVRAEASKLKSQATDKARQVANEGKDKATSALDSFAKLIDDAANAVDDRMGEQYGGYARAAADTVAGIASQLRGKDVDELFQDARGFVKKSPAVAIGAAAAIGFVMARLVKAGLDADSAPASSTEADDAPPAA